MLSSGPKWSASCGQGVTATINEPHETFNNGTAHVVPRYPVPLSGGNVLRSSPCSCESDTQIILSAEWVALHCQFLCALFWAWLHRAWSGPWLWLLGRAELSHVLNVIFADLPREPPPPPQKKE